MPRRVLRLRRPGSAATNRENHRGIKRLPHDHPVGRTTPPHPSLKGNSFSRGLALGYGRVRNPKGIKS
jgi:hypothetical protein